MEQIYQINYDEVADFLEVFVGSSSKCVAEEVEPGIVVRRDEYSGEIKSIGIFSFKKRAVALAEILKKNNICMDFPLNVGV